MVNEMVDLGSDSCQEGLLTICQLLHFMAKKTDLFILTVDLVNLCLEHRVYCI